MGSAGPGHLGNVSARREHPNDVLKYAVIIEWSDEDDVFVARVPDLPGCMAHGHSYDQAVREVQDAMDIWLDVARQRGREIPLPAVKVAA